MIAAMDATANEVPAGFEVQGYPMVLCIPGSTEKLISYDGAREANAMFEFIKSNRVD